MEHNENTELLRRLIEREAWNELSEQYEELHVQDIATVLEELETGQLVQAFETVAEEEQIRVLAYLTTQGQARLLDALEEQEGRRLLRGLSPDDRTALLESLPRRDAEQLLRLLDFGEVKQALKLLGYPEESAGRLMTTRFVTVRPEWTLGQALSHVRNCGENEDTINTLYVTDRRGLLVGTVGLKRVVLGDPDQKIESLVTGPTVTIRGDEDREEAARLIQHYDITALPVVDARGALLGVVTVDDVMDVVQEETTEDFQKIGAVGVFNLSLHDASLTTLFQKRVGWLVLLVFVNMFAGEIIGAYEEAIEGLFVLMTFLPLVVDSGGNAGTQSATLMVRAMATGDVKISDWLKLLGKELGVAAALGTTMAIAVFLVAYFWRAEGVLDVSVVIALGMIGVVVVGSLVGMLLPFGLAKLNMDPATASAPLITSVADLAGIAMYFGIAATLLGLTV